MSDNNQKENLLTKFLKAIHEYYIISFVFLFVLSIIIFVFLYFGHSKKIENRFDKTLQNYEKSMSDIFNNIITNGINENIYTNSFQTNNNQLQNDSIDKLKLSFEVGFKMLESSMNEIMKNSNDILQFWFAFLSIIMIVFNLAGALINNNILSQAREQLRIIEKEARTSRENIGKETRKLIQENNLFNLGVQSYNSKDYKMAEHYFNEVIKLNPNYSVVYYNRGLAKYYLKDYEGALEDYNKAIELNPKFAEAYFYRGISKYNLANAKKKSKADYKKLLYDVKEDYNKAIELNPKFAEAYFNRAEIKSIFAKFIKNNKKEYNKLFKEAYSDFKEAYRLFYDDDILKNKMEAQFIKLIKENNEVAIKFCEEHNINYKDNDNKE